MEITGERYSADIDWPEISYEHWHRYLWCSQFVSGKKVLDLACGEGYGSYLFADYADHVIGVDVDPQAIQHAAEKYVKPNLEFICGPADAIPVDGFEVFDVIVCFETIEHLNEATQLKFMDEVRRLLRPDGKFIVSTPNKFFYTDKSSYNNEFHLKEFYLQEFIDFLRRFFNVAYLLGQRIYPVSYVWPLQASQQQLSEYQLEHVDGHFEPAGTDAKEVLYMLAVCSDLEFDPPGHSLLLDNSDQVISQRAARLVEQEKAINALRTQIAEYQAQLQKDAADIATLQSAVVERDAQLHKDAADIATLQLAVVERDAQLHKDAADIATLQSAVVERDAQLHKDAADIATLQSAVVERDAQLHKDAADIAILQAQGAERHAHIVQLQRQSAELAAQVAHLSASLEAIRQSLAWRIATRASRLRHRILPDEGRAWRFMRRAGELWWREGARGIVQRGLGRLRRSPAVSPATPPASPTTSIDDYQRWIAEYEPDADTLRQQVADARKLAAQPLISVLASISEPDPTLLAAMIDSVRQQTYGRWELWLVTSSAETTPMGETLDRLVGQDTRIHTFSLDMPVNIASGVNAALQQIDGEVTTFIGQHDILAPFALFAIADMLSQHVNAAMLYSDCDRISTDGVSRFQPEFKPDWSPAMLLSASYTEHLCAIRTSLLRELGGLLPERGDAVYWDLALRVAEHRVAVIHIPRVLYHVRTSANPSDGIDAGEAARIAIAEHLLRRGLDAQVQLTPTGNIRAVWPLRRQPHVSIVIPSRNLVILRRCIDSINERTAYSHFDFTVIDTTPDGELEKAYHDDNHVHVIRYTEPFNYSAVNNIAARQTHGEFLLFLNDDIEVIDTGWLEELLRWGELEEIGIVGAKLLRADRRIQHAGVVLGMGGFAGHPFDGAQEGQQTIYGSVEWYRNYSAVTGACMLVRRAVFEQVGGFDEQFILCGSDVELCLRVREAGYQVVYTPFARLYHIESATRGAMIPSIDFALSYVHYQPLLSAGDPYYNPNLSLWSPEPRYRRRDEVDMLEHVHRSLEQLGVTQLVSTLMRERKQHRHKNQNGGSTYASNSRERDAAGT